jgi:Xaa-Pro aminopeptidase/Xaa-Pro dipeptidase
MVIARLNGLHVENERTWFCGEPSPPQVDAFQTMCDAQAAAIAKLVAGVPVRDVDAAALDIIRRSGYEDAVFHRTGHGVGIACHEYPHDMAFNPRPLRAGEVYSVEPGIYLYGLGGFRHDDTVIVGETAPEVITRSPKDLTSQTISARGH